MLSVQQLNDAFRAQLAQNGGGVPGRIVLTRGVAALPETTLAAVVARVESFATFTPENDPHGEHDFGSFTVGDQRFFWKFDYYADRQLEFGAEDARDCFRLLTIMLAEEY